MNAILEPCIGIFTFDELKNAVPVNNTCPYCNEKCGTIFSLQCCPKTGCSTFCCGGVEMCGTCLDDLYDSGSFKCPECYRDVVDYEPI